MEVIGREIAADAAAFSETRLTAELARSVRADLARAAAYAACAAVLVIDGDIAAGAAALHQARGA